MKSNTVTQDKVDEIFNHSDLIERVVFNKCLIVTVKLRSGFVIVESSSCVDPKNFDIEIGREICCNKIKNKIWELEGYKLQCELEGGFNKC